MTFSVVIPARFASSRLPGKPLLLIANKPMIVHVIERALQAGASRVMVASDHPDILLTAEQAGAQACLTRADHQSGTERLAEVVEQCQLADDEIIVNVQGDEPLIPPALIQQVANNLAQRPQIGMATLAETLAKAGSLFDANCVKVVRCQQQFALYFSRAPIPWHREHSPQLAKSPDEDIHTLGYLRHIGIYAYRAGFIRRYVQWPTSPLEQIEMLEQLRVLWHGEKIHVDLAVTAAGQGVDTPADLQRVRELMQALPKRS